MTNADPPLELRVHGVGGPQARKMLGCQHEEDVATLPPFTPPGAADEDEDRIPEDEQSRFARRIPDDMTEAYEWGGLTTGSWVKALWVLYLPFTLINAGGGLTTPPSPTTTDNPSRWASTW